MKRLFTVFLAFVLFAGAFSAWSQNTVLSPDSALALQTVPVYEGVEEFEAKIQKIREEEGREPLGLVLCGGSARAFCHIGVLKAMEENDIVPDFIIANSMGAVIGMLYAYGFSPQKIEEIISEININSYFEPVFPLRGGLLSVRKFEALVNQLLGEESHRVEDCAIPILLLTEDLYTKRQIWHCSGDFAKIMDATFAMSVFMEPVNYTLEYNENAGTNVKLIDSGAIDIGGLKVAYKFSDNIMISTAFYDSELDYNNPIVVINRTMSIGKERIAIKDILDLEPVLIRNDVEHFSFMDFQKAEQISMAGYTTAASMMEQLAACPHKKLSLASNLLERRKTTDVLGDEQIFRTAHDFPVKLGEPYAGVKLWPVFRVVDFPDSYLYDNDGIALDAFIDIPGASFKLRANQSFDFEGLCADALIKFEPSYFVSAELLGSYDFSYDDFEKSSFYGFAGINLRPAFLPACCKSFVFTGEWIGNWKFESQKFLFTIGFKNIFGNENDTYLFVKPFVFAAGSSFSDLKADGTGLGLGGDIESCWNFVEHAGIGEYAYVKYNFGAHDFDADNRNELYFIHKSPDITFAETLILQQIKVGSYYEFESGFRINPDGIKGSFDQFAGIFVRGDVSVIGLSNFIMEGGCGWDFSKSRVYGSFNLKCRM
ncbi:MAG: patatin-like phospholipase family protein [Treponema sp.]|nr:patatin-like phospholipase family protein [Treponema sp.]